MFLGKLVLNNLVRHVTSHELHVVTRKPQKVEIYTEMRRVLSKLTLATKSNLASAY